MPSRNVNLGQILDSISPKAFLGGCCSNCLSAMLNQTSDFTIPRNDYNVFALQKKGHNVMHCETKLSFKMLKEECLIHLVKYYRTRNLSTFNILCLGKHLRRPSFYKICKG